jgi:hypothetical protein
MRSHEELTQAAGCERRAEDFYDLLHILYDELRLITPTDPEGSSADETSQPKGQTAHRYYQLTHDYLVPSLREWLTRKQKETRRGRAELRLAERAALWSAKPENRHLPSWWEWLNIRLLTSRRRWTGPQQAMMLRAMRLHGVRVALALLVLLALGIVTQQFVALNKRKQADMLVRAVLTARAQAVPYAIANLESLREYVTPMLQQQLAKETSDPIQRLHAAMALAHFGENRADVLIEGIAVAPSGELANIVVALENADQSYTVSLREKANKCDADANWPLKYRYAAVALHGDDSTLAREMCSLRPDPIQRTMFIETFPKWHAVAELSEAAQGIDDPALRSAVCLGVGSLPPAEVDAATQRAWVKLLSDWYQTARDTGTHSAAGWALRQWGVELPKITASHQPAEGREWHVNSVGLTMLRIPAGNLDVKDEYGCPRRLTVKQPFLLSDREVTVGQFQQFVADPGYPSGDKPQNWPGADKSVSPTVDHPVQQVNWHDAVLFCNWLSRKERLNPAYAGSGDKWNLVSGATGYRLPTEVEWEYACRAGTTTDWASGDDVMVQRDVEFRRAGIR